MIIFTTKCEIHSHSEVIWKAEVIKRLEVKSLKNNYEAAYCILKLKENVRNLKNC